MEWTEERREKLREMRETGCSNPEIAAALDTSVGMVCNMVSEMGLPRREHFIPKSSPVDWNTAAAERLWPDLSITTREIAERVGITNNQLCGYANRHREQFPERTAHHRGINLRSAQEKGTAIKVGLAKRGAGAKRPPAVKFAGNHVVPKVTLPPVERRLAPLPAEPSIPARLRPIFAAPRKREPAPIPHSPFHTCQYIDGPVTRPALFCGEPTLKDADGNSISSWCPAHHKVCCFRPERNYLPKVYCPGPDDRTGIALR